MRDLKDEVNRTHCTSFLSYCNFSEVAGSRAKCRFLSITNQHWGQGAPRQAAFPFALGTPSSRGQHSGSPQVKVRGEVWLVRKQHLTDPLPPLAPTVNIYPLKTQETCTSSLVREAQARHRLHMPFSQERKWKVLCRGRGLAVLPSTTSSLCAPGSLGSP